MRKLRFKDVVRPRPAPSGIDLLVTLKHFALITYAVSPSRLQGLIPGRFALDTVPVGGSEKALISVMPFLDGNLTSAVRPFPCTKVGQTDYRTYIIDKDTGDRCVWFFGATLDTWIRFIPRLFWRLPCYRGSTHFDCDYDASEARYVSYHMQTASRWAPAEVELFQDGTESLTLQGFPDVETGLVVLTHPVTGWYYRSNGDLGAFDVWHEPLQMQPARLRHASFRLLENMGLVAPEEQQMPHSVLLDASTEFTVYLPPRILPRGRRNQQNPEIG